MAFNKPVVISLLALLTSSAAYAQTPVTQGVSSTGLAGPVKNTGNITNTADIKVNKIEAKAIGASVSSAATGASTNISTNAINSSVGFIAASIGPVKQDTLNTGVIRNTADIELKNKSTLGAGASIASVATGAVSSFSASAIKGTNFGGVLSGNIDQKTINRGSVINTTQKIELRTSELKGDGSSVSASATGAASNVSASFINAQGAPGGGLTPVGINNILQNIDQNSRNFGNVANNVQSDINLGDLKGAGTSVNISAVGSNASVGLSGAGNPNLTLVGTTPGLTTGLSSLTLQTRLINQKSFNNAKIDNNAANTKIETANLTGAGSSLSIAAVGASSSVGASAVANNKTSFIAPPIILDGVAITQNSTNVGNVTNNIQGTVFETKNMSGKGASMSLSAVGAVSSAGTSSIGAGGATLSVQNIQQTATNTATITNKTNGGKITALNLSGDGASISSSAIGASTSVSISSNSAARIFLAASSINQFVANRGPVSNLFANGNVKTADLSGESSSVSISAIGASASIGLSSISSSVTTVNMPAQNGPGVLQNVRNSGLVSNNISGAEIKVGKLSGNGASISVSAVGASASYNISSISSGGISALTSATNQIVNNSGNITNNISNGSITSDTLSGAGSSISANAIGASASVGITDIATLGILRTFTGTQITQSVLNTGNISNTSGIINAGTLTGNGSSVSSSAVGASASVSFTRIN